MDSDTHTRESVVFTNENSRMFYDPVSTSSYETCSVHPGRRSTIKQGSLTINNLTQQYSYDDSFIPVSDNVITTIVERKSQETAGHFSDGPCHQIEPSDDGELDLLEDIRVSSSSRASQAPPSWRPWYDKSCCFGLINFKFTWFLDPQGPLSYVWLLIVTIALVHNLIHIPLRFAFCRWNMNLGFATMTTEDIKNGETYTSALETIPIYFTYKDLLFWMIPDYFFDFIYILDIFKSMRTGFFEEGSLNSNPQAIFNFYISSGCFYADLLSLLPLDVLYLSFGLNSLLRLPRLIKLYRAFQFIDWTERHTRWPNLVRSTKIFIYLIVVCHWNAALCKTALLGHETIWFASSKSNMSYNDQFDIVAHYRNYTPYQKPLLWSATDLPFYWAWLYVSVSTLCTLGLSGSIGLSYDESPAVFAFLILQMMLGLVLFAVAIGEIMLIVDSLGARRRKFQIHLDGVKSYMIKRDIPKPVSGKVIRWFDYIWESKRGLDEEQLLLQALPECLQAEISLHAYLHALKRVEFFRNTKAGFLKELVLKLKPVFFGPGEYVCRKGEIGKQMYIVEVGILQVFSGKGTANAKPVALLRKGQYFGELSILNMGKAGNRRTATVRSLGYSHLLSLCKEDLLNVLEDFPKEQERLEYFAARRCKQFADEKIIDKIKKNSSQNEITFSEGEHWSNILGSPQLLADVNKIEVANEIVSQSSSSSSSTEPDEFQRAIEQPVQEVCRLPSTCSSQTTHMRRSSLANTNVTHGRFKRNLAFRFQTNDGLPGSPFLRRMARSMDALTARESKL